MKTLQKTLLASSIVLALGSVSTVWANPNNHDHDGHNNTQTATLDSTQGGNNSPQANEFSTATDNSDHSYVDNTDNSDNSTTDNSDNSDQGYADVSGTGAAANNNSSAYFTRNDSHNTDNSTATSNGDFSAAANNGGTAEVHMAIAESNLDGYVTNNHTDFSAKDHGDLNYYGNNSADGAVAGANGVVNFSQNTGQNALTQQSVSTQASLTLY
jgi:hypothetical protein